MKPKDDYTSSSKESLDLLLIALFPFNSETEYENQLGFFQVVNEIVNKTLSGQSKRYILGVSTCHISRQMVKG